VREYLLVFLVAGTVAYLLTVIAREIAIRTHAVAAVRDRDVHDEPVPYLGGIALLGGLWAAFLIARELPFLSRDGTFVFEDAQQVLIAGSIVCVIGVLDDIVELDWTAKLGGQVLAVGYLVFSGIRFQFLPLPNGQQFSLDPNQGALLTAFVVIATINAVNFVDGLDGLAAGVIGIGAVAFFLFSYQLSALNHVSLATTPALLSAALAGACTGFLPHNFHPARLFMGDSGALTLGLLLSAATITLTGNVDPGQVSANEVSAAFLPVLVPLSVLLLPFLDMVLAVVRRTRAGKRPWQPDAMHLHHRMLRIGHGHRRAVLILYLWAAIVALGSVSFVIWDGPRPLAVVGAAAAMGVVLTVWLPRWRPSERL
jgi:UDP-GlcNAc:undecaprenyl-phosphate GlcNAc-1-phosphate transferase